MAFAFDTPGYAKKLRDSGVSSEQAEARAEAARDFVMHELVTRYHRQAVKDDLGSARRELEASIDRLSLRLTIRMGVMLAAGLTILGAVLKTHS